jgi:hypothetical protein
MTERLYLLKLKLKDIEPEIWRRFYVPAAITLESLHQVIRILMDWDGSHHHKFVIKRKRYLDPDYADTDEGELYDHEYRLMDLVKTKGSSFLYVYDFGDYWEHEITVEDTRYIPPKDNLTGQLIKSPSVQCLDGARTSPPEDVGGVPGYNEYCEAVNSPDPKDYDAMEEWLAGFVEGGEEFGTEYFNLEEINSNLKEYSS